MHYSAKVGRIARIYIIVCGTKLVMYTRASAPVRSVDVYAPQLEPARQRRRPFLAFILLWRLSRCFLYVSDRSRVIPRQTWLLLFGRGAPFTSTSSCRCVCPCYLGGMLSSWFKQCSVSDASGSVTRIETACLGSVSPQHSPRSDVQLAERGIQHSHIASMLYSGCHLYRC